MVVGWLADNLSITGGAELSDDAFIAGAPPDVEIVHCPPGKRPPPGVDVFVINNCITYGKQWLEVLAQRPVVKHIHDLWPFGSPILRRWILDNAALVIFNSPKHEELFQFPYSAPHAFVPPPVDIERFRAAASEAGGREREDILWLGRISAGKGLHNVADWALRNGRQVDFYGLRGNSLAQAQIVPPCRYCGPVVYDDLPDLLAKYSALIHLPVKANVCGRVAVEAWAAGCELILGGDVEEFWRWVENVGAQGFRDAPADFWEKVKRATTR